MRLLDFAKSYELGRKMSVSSYNDSRADPHRVINLSSNPISNKCTNF